MRYERCLATLEPLTGAEAGKGYRNKALRGLFDTSRVVVPLTFSRREFFQQSTRYVRGLSISGVQQKLSLKLNPASGELEPTNVGGEYILKPSPEEYPYAAENEHTAMLASKLLGIPTAGCALVAFSDGELAYITRRFDRNRDGSKVHQEDLLQIGEHGPGDKYGLSYETAGELVDRATGGKLAAKLDLFRRVLFAYAIGNNDLHMKNLSVQRLEEKPGGEFDCLTPNYDVLFAQAFENQKDGQFLACDLLSGPEPDEEEFTEQYLEYGFYTGHDFLELGRRYGLGKRAVEKALMKQIRSRDAILALIEASYMPAAMKAEASTLVVERTKGISIGVG